MVSIVSPLVNSHSRDLADHGALRGHRRSSEAANACSVQPARGVPLVQQNAETLADHNFTAGFRLQSIRGESMECPLQAAACRCPPASIILGMEPRVAMPIPPHAVQSMTMPRVCGRVVRKLDVILHSRSLAEL